MFGLEEGWNMNQNSEHDGSSHTHTHKKPSLMQLEFIINAILGLQLNYDRC